MTTQTHRASLFSRRGLVAAVVLGAVALTAAPYAGTSMAAKPAAKPHINIGTKNFGEEYVISDMYKLLLEKAGFNVGGTHNLATTDVLQKALLKGQIDMYPEYTGTGLEVVLKQKGTANESKAFKTDATQYKKKWNLIWLKASAFNDTNGVGVLSKTASKYHLKTLSDLAKASKNLSFAALPDCQSRADCLPGLQNVYKVNFKKITYVDSQPVMYRGLNDGTYDVIEVFTSDGPIQVLHVTVLKDNKGIFPADHVAPVVRGSILKKYPKIKTVLNKLAPKLTLKAIINLNTQVVVNSKDPLVVARAFLKSNHLL